MISRLTLVFSIFLLLPRLSAQEVFDHEIDLKDERVAQFRLWLPPGIKEIRAVITLAPGLQGDARNEVLDGKWQELATRHSAALLGLRLRNTDRSYYHQTWAFDAIDTALRELGRETGRGELQRAP